MGSEAGRRSIAAGSRVDEGREGEQRIVLIRLGRNMRDGRGGLAGRLPVANCLRRSESVIAWSRGLVRGATVLGRHSRQGIAGGGGVV